MSLETFSVDRINLTQGRGWERTTMPIEKELIRRNEYLVRMGSYRYLGGGQYRDELDLSMQGQSLDAQRRLKGAIAHSWIRDQAHFIANHTDAAYKDEIIGLEKSRFEEEGVDFEHAFSQMTEVFGLIAKFQSTHDVRYLSRIEQSDLIQSRSGLLRVKSPRGLSSASIKDSAIQQGRMFLLGIRGLTPMQAKIITNYVKEPPNIGRENVGKLPAGIIAMGARLGLDWSELANRGWPTPKESVPKLILPDQYANDAYDNYVIKCAEEGWELPSMSQINPTIVSRVTKIRNDTSKRMSWVAPLWRDPQTQDLYTSNGVLVAKPVGEERAEVIKPVDRQENYGFRILRWASVAVGLLGLMKTGKL